MPAFCTVPRNYRGENLRFVGVGNYPYDCPAKDADPDALIFRHDGAWDAIVADADCQCGNATRHAGETAHFCVNCHRQA